MIFFETHYKLGWISSKKENVPCYYVALVLPILSAEKRQWRCGGVHYLGFCLLPILQQQVGASTTHKLPYGSTRTALTVAHSFPELIWNLADFLTNWFNLIKKFSSRILFFETNEMTFLHHFPKMCISFSFIIWSGWNQLM